MLLPPASLTQKAKRGYSLALLRLTFRFADDAQTEILSKTALLNHAGI
jgi:hypothetical protein